MKKLRSITVSIFRAPFRPPFQGLAFFVWVFFALSFVLHPHSPIKQGHYVDSDDYLYLVQAIDWIKGQSWFDTTQYRMNPPEGTPIHFSALMNFVYGVPIALLAKFIGIQRAADITAIVFPLVYFAVLLFVVRRTAELFMEKEWAGVTAYVTLFASSLMMQFIPGRVDHHGLEGLFGLTAFGFAARMMLRPEELKYACATGMTLAFALAIALEIAPVLVALTAVVGLWALLSGGAATRAGFTYALTLFVVSGWILLTTAAPGHWFESTNFQAFSILYVALAGGFVLCFGAIVLARDFPLHIRTAIVVLTAFAAGGAVARLFFDSFGSPINAMDAENLNWLVNRHDGEMWPILQRGPLRGPFVRSMCLPIVAFASLYLFSGKIENKIEKRLRWPMVLLAALLTASYGFALFSMQRMMVFADAFSIVPLALLVQNVWRMTDRIKDAPRSALAFRIFIVLLVGPLTTVLFPALSGEFSPVDVALFPVQFTETTCDQNGLINVLNTTFGDHPHILMNMMTQSPELLLRTQDMIIAAPYPMDMEGNDDGYRFFMTENPAEAEAIARKHKADLVIACKNYEDIYNSDDDDLDYGEVREINHARMMQRLVDGKIPGWLRPVPAPLLGDTLLFQVLPPVAANKKP